MDDKLLNILTHFADQLKEIAVKTGPHVWDITLTMAKITALNELIRNISNFLLPLVVAIVSYKYILKFYPKMVFDECGPNRFAVGFMAAFLMCLGASFFTSAYITPLFDVWQYVGIVKPEIYLAHQLIGATHLGGN